MEILELFSLYGIDSALMAATAAFITFLLDRFILSKIPDNRARAAAKLLPYVLGMLFYAVYAFACNYGINCFFGNLSEIIKQGLAIGTLAMLFKLAFVKIIAGKKAEITAKEAVESIIEGYICPDELKNAAVLLCNAAKSGDSGEVEKLIKEYAAENITAEQIEAVKLLILTYFNVTQN